MRASSTASPAAASASAFRPPCAETNNPAHSASSACQLPRPRSCSCAIADSSAATRCGARCAAASANIDDTGLRLCGMALEPPRPAPDGSASSPISPCPIKAQSVAILLKEPTSTPISQPSETQSPRCVCHTPCGSGSCSRPATRRATAGPCVPSVASEPTAPPNCSCSARGAAACRRCCAPTSAASQPASLKPKLVTDAGCISVRASSGAWPWRS